MATLVPPMQVTVTVAPTARQTLLPHRLPMGMTGLVQAPVQELAPVTVTVLVTVLVQAPGRMVPQQRKLLHRHLRVLRPRRLRPLWPRLRLQLQLQHRRREQPRLWPPAGSRNTQRERPWITRQHGRRQPLPW